MNILAHATLPDGTQIQARTGPYRLALVIVRPGAHDKDPRRPSYARPESVLVSYESAQQCSPMVLIGYVRGYAHASGVRAYSGGFCTEPYEPKPVPSEGLPKPEPEPEPCSMCEGIEGEHEPSCPGA